MTIAMNGFDVLKRIGDAPDTFRAIRADADKAARTLAIACIKKNAADLSAIRAISGALGDEQFALLIDGTSDTMLRSLIAKLDGERPDTKAMSSHELRRHLLALVSGTVERSLPTATDTKAAADKISKIGRPPKRLQSDVMDLFRARGRMRDED